MHTDRDNNRTIKRWVRYFGSRLWHAEVLKAIAGLSGPTLHSVLPIPFVMLMGVSSCVAQEGFPAKALPQITQPIVDSSRATLTGSVHPLARAEFDQGLVPDATPVPRMMLLLRRSPDREASLNDRIAQLHNSNSPQFHNWLTPKEIGDDYGPADEDLAALETWLIQSGFRVESLHPAKLAIEISGTAGQVRGTFHTEIHRYLYLGHDYTANSADPQVPSALLPLIAGIAPLNNFPSHSNLINKGPITYTPRGAGGRPQWTYPPSGGEVFYALAPGDFKVQYDVGAKFSGEGYTIGIIGQSNVDVSLVNSYRSLFGLPFNPPQVVLDGGDPGQNGADGESYLDLEASGGIAPKARILLYTSSGSVVLNGLFAAAQRAVDDNVADILSMSYGDCEQHLLASNLFFYQLWQQAAAQGQTVSVSAGDAGPAVCDDFHTAPIALQGYGVNGFASTPFNVAVGGTDFYYADGTSISSFWTGGESDTPTTSLTSVIPEQPWNDPFGINRNTKGFSPGEGIVAGSGGMSSCGKITFIPGQGVVCVGGYSKPTWQTGKGVPPDSVRDVPDVSLFAANGANFSFWPICAAPGDCTTTSSATGTTIVSRTGGTSASAPAFAGIIALVDQAQRSRLGQVNYVLYPLAAQFPSVFHDVTIGSNKVPCQPESSTCPVDPATGQLDFGFTAAPGYDLATGLGSFDVGQLISNWNNLSFQTTATILSLGATQIVHGQNVNLNVIVKATAGGGVPTGEVSITTELAGSSSGEGVLSFPLQGEETADASPVFPGGSYWVDASYSGDAVFSSSKSNPIPLTVLPEPSFIQFASFTKSVYSTTALPYGSTLRFAAQPVGASGYGIPTGAVSFTDSAGGSFVAPLDSSGVAEWDVSNFGVGQRTVSAAYGGDSSFSAPTAAASIALSIVKGSPTIQVIPLASSVPVGGAISLDVFVSGSAPSQATAPTGAVTITVAGQQQTVTLAPITGQGRPGSLGTIVFTNLPSGSFPVSASYSGDPNWSSANVNAGTFFVGATTASFPSSTILKTTTPSVLESNGNALLSIVIKGNGTLAPTGTATLFDNGREVDKGTIVPGQTLSSINFTLSGYTLAIGTNSFVAVYSGDMSYSASSSAIVSVNASVGDFALNITQPQVQASPGGSIAETIYLTSEGLAGPVSVQCSTPTSIISCALSPSTLSLSAGEQAPLQLSVSTGMSLAQISNRKDYFGGLPLCGFAMAGVCFCAFSKGNRNRLLRAIILCISLMPLTVGCGERAVPLGTYTVTVTANMAGIIHDGIVTVNVQ